MNYNYNNQLDTNLPGNIDSKKAEYHYTFLIVFDKNSFETRYKSPSKWYRIFSNSNQMTGYKSNRDFWNETFIGGEYDTFICENEVILHFKLELKKPFQNPNELGMKLRIGKSSKGIKYELILNKSYEVLGKIMSCESCNSSIRKIGKWYVENYQSKVINKDSLPQV